MRQNVAALFYIALLLTLMPYTYMSMFVADRVFFLEDPLQPPVLNASVLRLCVRHQRRSVLMQAYSQHPGQCC